jgi:hypothetical protein
MTEPDHETRPAPKLNVVAVNESLGFGYGLVVVATNERLKSYEMPVITDRVSPIIRHRSSKGRNSPVNSLETSGDLNGSSPSQSMHWNLRPPIF